MIPPGLARLRAVVRKEFIHIRRDPQTLALTFLMPIMMMLIYGYAIRLDLSAIPLVVCDRDHTPASRDLVGALASGAAFRLIGFRDSADELRADLVAGRAKIALTIPAGYARGGAPVQVLVDGSEPNSGTVARNYIEAFLAPRASPDKGSPATIALPPAALPSAALPPAAFSTAALPSAAAFPLRARVWYNPEMKSADFVVPGLVAILMMMVCALLTSMTVSRERERGTFEQLFVSPVQRLEILAGKLLPYLLLAFLVAVAVIGFGQLVFGVPLRGSAPLLAALSLLYAFTALGIGLFISTLVRTQQAAMTGALMATIMPSVMLSGFFFPVRSMPDVLQGLCWFIPARHYLVIIRGIVLRGAGLADLWPSVVYLLVLGLVFLGVSTLRFRTALK